jgi:opacity protein-like surface antigen
VTSSATRPLNVGSPPAALVFAFYLSDRAWGAGPIHPHFSLRRALLPPGGISLAARSAATIRFVIGLERDGDWSHLSGTTFNTSCVGLGCQTKSDWLATERGRAGWTWHRVMFYGTGGVAFANVQAAAGAPSSSTQTGWAAGVGIEYAFTPNWTAKVEYLFVDLGNQSCSPVNCSGTHRVAERKRHPRRREL